MKKGILTLAAALMMSLGASAQQFNGGMGQFDPAKMMQQRTEQMVSQYKLNEEQAAKLKAIHDEQAKSMGQPGNRGNGQRNMSQEDREKRRAEFTKRQEEYNKKLQEIMTEEQYKAYQKDMEEMQARFRR